MNSMINLEDEPNVDLTPLIDVIFMLLIFFIMTTTFSRPVLDIVLPSAVNAEPSQNKKEMVVSVKSDGSLHYEGKQINSGELAAILEQSGELLLNLHVDKKAPFETFVNVVDIAKTKKEGRFVISTQQGKD